MASYLNIKLSQFEIISFPLTLVRDKNMGEKSSAFLCLEKLLMGETPQDRTLCPSDTLRERCAQLRVTLRLKYIIPIQTDLI
ncbi:hypothetical protein Riv7116_6785 [Rivularia sp. PCC 7116]|nr:hypothetical protein Riv7116_6785 [Rivularia sp. PCC 7116]